MFPANMFPVSPPGGVAGMEACAAEASAVVEETRTAVISQQDARSAEEPSIRRVLGQRSALGRVPRVELAFVHRPALCVIVTSLAGLAFPVLASANPIPMGQRRRVADPPLIDAECTVERETHRYLKADCRTCEYRGAPQPPNPYPQPSEIFLLQSTPSPSCDQLEQAGWQFRCRGEDAYVVCRRRRSTHVQRGSSPSGGGCATAPVPPARGGIQPVLALLFFWLGRGRFAWRT